MKVELLYKMEGIVMKQIVKYLSGIVVIGFMCFIIDVMAANALFPANVDPNSVDPNTKMGIGIRAAAARKQAAELNGSSTNQSVNNDKPSIFGIFNDVSTEPEKKEYTDEEKKQAVKDALADDKITEEEEENLLEMYGGDQAALIKDMLPELILNYISDGDMTDAEISKIEALVKLAEGDNEMLAEALVTAFPKLNKDEMVTIFNSEPNKVNSNIKEYAKAGADTVADKNNKTVDETVTTKGGLSDVFSTPAETPAAVEAPKSAPSTSVTQTNGNRCPECGVDLRTGTHPKWCKRGAGIVTSGNEGDNMTSKDTVNYFKPKDNSSSTTSATTVDKYNGKILCGNKSMHDAQVASIGRCMACDRMLKKQAAQANNSSSGSSKLPDAKPGDFQCDYCGNMMCTGGQILQEEICNSCAKKGITSSGGSSSGGSNWNGGSTSGGCVFNH